MTETPRHPPAALSHPAQTVHCIRCGYDLYGATIGRTCPECGLDVADSLRGPYLRSADQHWVKRVARGALAGLIGASLFATLVCLWVTFSILERYGVSAQPGFLGWPASGILHMLVAFVHVAGVWLITTPDPGRAMPSTDFVRTLARWFTIVGLAAFATRYILILLGWPALGSEVQILVTRDINLGPILALIASLAGFVGRIFFWLHIRRLAMRIPSRRLARHAIILLVAGVTISVLTKGMEVMMYLGLFSILDYTDIVLVYEVSHLVIPVWTAIVLAMLFTRLARVGFEDRRGVPAS